MAKEGMEVKLEEVEGTVGRQRHAEVVEVLVKQELM